eukprot:8976743-Prorocentrum_lima.AAC.1
MKLTANTINGGIVAPPFFWETGMHGFSVVVQRSHRVWGSGSLTHNALPCSSKRAPLLLIESV